MGFLIYIHIMIANIAYPYKINYASLPGNCDVAYMDEGVGEKTLLFIHGLANYAPVWKKNIAELKKYYRCIALDLPGNGLSDQNEHPFTMKFFAECVYNFIRALKLKNVCIVGHSMGGQVAMTTVLNHPGCADLLVLCAPAGIEPFSMIEKSMFFGSIHLLDFFASDEHNLRSTIEHSFYRNHAQAETVIKELAGLMKTYKPNYYRKMIESCIKAMLDEPVIDRISQLSLPVRVIFGEKDALIPNKLIHHTTTAKLAADAVKKMPDASLEMIPDCGHFIQWEKSEEVNRDIIGFIEKGR